MGKDKYQKIDIHAAAETMDDADDAPLGSSSSGVGVSTQSVLAGSGNGSGSQQSSSSGASADGAPRYFTLGPISIDERNMQSVSCVTMVIQAVALVLALKRAQSVSKDELFINTTAVFLSECTKFFVCLYIVFAQETNADAPFLDRMGTLWRLITGDKRALLLISIPATLYALQNNLNFIAVANLPATVYQIVMQLKVITTAIFSILVFGRHISAYKWLSLVILMAGVAVVQLDGKSAGSSAGDPLYGFIAVLTAATISGFAGVFLEKLLKDPSVTIWRRNVQLAFFGIVSSGLMCMGSDFGRIQSLGFFHGYNPLVALVVVNHAIGGLVVALVVKYADNLVKGFAASLSIILSAVIFVLVFDSPLTSYLVVGGALVLLSSYMYSQPDAVAAPAAGGSDAASASIKSVEMVPRGTLVGSGDAGSGDEGFGRVSTANVNTSDDINDFGDRFIDAAAGGGDDDDDDDDDDGGGALGESTPGTVHKSIAMGVKYSRTGALKAD